MPFLKGLFKFAKKATGGADSGKAARLFKDTEAAHRDFVRDAKALGITLSDINLKNYYDILEMKYTNDRKLIKASYIKLAKKYHPDVSGYANAGQKMAEINGAYEVLSDPRRKAEYDQKFSKGRNRMGPDITTVLHDELMRRYVEARNRDFEEFNSRVAMPQQIDSIRAAIEETVNWTKCFTRVSDDMFGSFTRRGKRIMRLRNINARMVKNASSAPDYDRLAENLSRLEGLAQAFKEAESGVNSVINGVMDEVSTEEANIAYRLRNSIIQ